jgi:hypothetical protein
MRSMRSPFSSPFRAAPHDPPTFYHFGPTSSSESCLSTRQLKRAQALSQAPSSLGRPPVCSPSLADSPRVSCCQALYQLAVVRKGAGDFVIAEGLLRTCAGAALPGRARDLRHLPWAMRS